MTYGADNFIEKNADRLHRDLVKLLAESSNPLAAELFREDASPAEPHNKARRHPSLSAQFKKQVCTARGACCLVARYRLLLFSRVPLGLSVCLAPKFPCPHAGGGGGVVTKAGRRGEGDASRGKHGAAKKRRKRRGP